MRTHLETVNIYDAKTRLSQLVDKAAAGEDVIVSRNGRPLVRITRLEGAKRQVRFGVLKGKIRIAKDFDAPLPEDVLAAFEGRGCEASRAAQRPVRPFAYRPERGRAAPVPDCRYRAKGVRRSRGGR
ncbi:MAG TPA: type II toxin-antitoxin system prevent-host-death family antitoxin [Burkholderiales bacterium]|nr:type II toxin-antitoxin system prevent-host-death family antitoxin [Burkholderiales bacterium]